MKPANNRLLWKLLLTNVVPVIGVIILIVWVAIDQLAAGYFMALMKRYEINPTDIHQMFLTSIHYYLIWASIAALVIAVVLSYLLTRRVLQPLSQLTSATKEVAAGDFSTRVEVTTNDEVADLGISFNRMADSLERIEQLRRNMVADVAHELRTPLTNLRGYLEALNDQVIAVSPETLDLLQMETLRLVRLVDNLQQLARADAARHYLKREQLHLSDLINDLLPLYQAQLQERDISLVITIAPDIDDIRADRDKLLQAIRNLLDNCSKYTPNGGTVAIIGRQNNQEIELRFCNTGTEISAADLPFIFERFFRTDRSRSRDIGGAGLGLAITKELIEAHGGRVGATSDNGETCVWLTLPR
jgi:two-component system sensor histidine kinase BaeS